VAFSEEIGHFNYCDIQDNSVTPGKGACLKSPLEAEVGPQTGTRNEADDLFCVDTASSTAFGSIQPSGGCLDSDVDLMGFLTIRLARAVDLIRIASPLCRNLSVSQARSSDWGMMKDGEMMANLGATAALLSRPIFRLSRIPPFATSAREWVA
jgi:hypothetical protein